MTGAGRFMRFGLMLLDDEGKGERIATRVVASFISSRFPEASGKQQSWDRRTLPARRYAHYAAPPFR